MTLALSPQVRPELPRPGQKVSWRDPGHAREWGWADLFGPGPFEVVRVVDKRDRGLAPDFTLRTAIGEWDISGFWLALPDDARNNGTDRLQGVG